MQHIVIQTVPDIWFLFENKINTICCTVILQTTTWKYHQIGSRWFQTVFEGLKNTCCDFKKGWLIDWILKVVLMPSNGEQITSFSLTTISWFVTSTGANLTSLQVNNNLLNWISYKKYLTTHVKALRSTQILKNDLIYIYIYTRGDPELRRLLL